MTITIDKTIYSDACLSKVLYELSDRFAFVRQAAGKYREEVRILPKGGNDFDEILFWQLMNDYHLRALIRQETQDLQTLLFAKAFAHFEDLTDNDLPQ